MKHNRKKVLVCILCLFILASVIFISTNFTYPIWKKDSVTLSEKITIGGIPQWILARGLSKENPLMLFLHGGPGDSESLLFRHYQKELENAFICVEWDQRGAGKSYDKNIPINTFNLEQLIADAHEVVQYLKSTFHKEKVYLVGHSFGSVIGIKLIERYPEDYWAYIGIGQMVNSNEQEILSYDYTMEQAKKRGNKEAVAELQSIGEPQNGNYAHPMDILVQRNWLAAFGGIRTDANDFLKYKAIVALAPEYNIIDKYNMLTVGIKTFGRMISDFTSVDLTKSTRFKVPIYFCLGKYDYNTPSSIAFEYFQTIEAPLKRIKWFDHSAHAPNFEEPLVFNEYVINCVLKDNGE